MLRVGSAVDDGQVAAAYNFKHTTIGSRVSIPQHIAAQIKGDLAEDGQGAADVDILRQPDDIRRIVRQSCSQLRLTRHWNVQPTGKSEVFGDGGGFLPLRAVLVPAIEGAAGLGGVGQGDLIALLQDLGGVILVVVEAVGHGNAADLVSGVIDAAVERAAHDAAIIVSINIHGIRAVSVSRAADDRHIAADGERSGVRDAAAVHLICTCYAFRMAVTDHRRAGQGGAANITIVGFAIIADAAAKSHPIALSHRCAAGDAAAGHGKRAAFSDKHAAAISNISLGLAADDITAVHGECAAAIHIHTAAVAIAVPVCNTLAAVDDAAVDSLYAAVFIQLPQAVVGDEPVLHCGVAVDKGQVAAALDPNVAHHAQDAAVEVKSDSAGDFQGEDGVGVVFKLDDIHRIVRQGSFQLGLSRHGETEIAGEGDILRHSRIVVPLRAVGGEPAVEFIARLGGFDGSGGETAAPQNLNGVVFTDDLVIHGDKTVGKAAATAVAIVGDLAIDGRAAAIQVDFAASQRYIRVNVGVFTDGHCAAVHKNVLLIHDIL